MQNRLTKYFLYLIIATLAYVAGDQKLLQDVFLKLGSVSDNLINHNNLGSPGSDSNEINNNLKIYLLGKYRVNKIVDGDTIHVLDESNTEDVVRIMAVNTLEVNSNNLEEKCFARKQTQFTKENLLNREVLLYGDKTQPERDKYRRILAYVATSTNNFVDEINNYFYNDYLVQTGNADIYRAAPPAILLKRFEGYRDIAKENRLGMWAGNCQ